MHKNRKKINSAILDEVFTDDGGYRDDLFVWDRTRGCWRALVTDAELAAIAEAAAGMKCSMDQVYRWRKSRVIAPVRKGGARPGAGRPKKSSEENEENEKLGLPRDYDRVMFLHAHDVRVLSSISEHYRKVPMINYLPAPAGAGKRKTSIRTDIVRVWLDSRGFGTLPAAAMITVMCCATIALPVLLRSPG